MRLKYRYLDLRRAALQKNFIARSNLYRATREYLHTNGFLEMETPFMVKYTPGGARNFLVPSRLNPGHFYALAESPQIFKQLFMVAGFDRYFQIVRCFRDEDLRLDRQPEFTQIDIEMSFVAEEDVFAAMEGLVAAIWKGVHGPETTVSFSRMKYDDAMERYGSDKPDLRFGLPLYDLTSLLAPLNGGGVPLFAGALEQKGIIKALRVPAADASTLSRAETDKLEEFVKGFGARGLARCKVGDNGEWTQTLALRCKSIDHARSAQRHQYGARQRRRRLRLFPVRPRQAGQRRARRLATAFGQEAQPHYNRRAVEVFVGHPIFPCSTMTKRLVDTSPRTIRSPLRA